MTTTHTMHVLHRQNEKPLRFIGEVIAEVNEASTREDWLSGKTECLKTNARLYKTKSGKYALEAELYNQDTNVCECRDAVFGDSLEVLNERLENHRVSTWLDADILGSLFQNTPISDKFVEDID